MNFKSDEQKQGQSLLENVWGLLLANNNHTSEPVK